MPNRTASPLNRATTLILLSVIILAGLILRTWNVNFDQGVGSHPDERSTACFYAPSIHLPASWDEFKDPQTSPMNPLWDLQNQRSRSFTYGHFPLYLGIATGEVLHKLAPIAEKLPEFILPAKNVELMRQANTACGGVAVAGRLMIALLDTLTILLLFFLGRRIYGKEAGLMAAAFYAFTAQAIQLSHFFAMDPASTTFTVLAVLGGVIWLQDRSWRGVGITALGMGLAVSSKFSAAPLLAVPVVVAGLLLWPSRLKMLAPAQRSKAQSVALLGAPLAILVAFVVFAVTSPYSILDWKNFAQATLVEQGQMVRGLADFPFTRQYRNSTPYLYFIQQQLKWGMWWPLGLVSLVGTLWAGVKVLLAKAKPEELIVWAWVVPYFGLTGAFLAKFNRYMSPVLPFVVLFAAGMIWTLFKAKGKLQKAKGKSDEGDPIPNPQSPIPNPQSLLASLLLAIALLGGLFWSLAYVNGVYGNPHTWVAASQWMYANIPAGSVIMWEQWDDALPKDLPEPGMNRGTAGLRNTDWGPYEEDTAQKYELLKAVLRESDYVSYSSKRIYGSVDELPERYPMTTKYYEMMWSGELGFELVLDQTSPPSLFGLTFQDRTADESWSLYDHPQATVFRKVRDLSDAEFDALLGNSWVGAKPYFRGKDSPLSPLLNLLGLGNGPDSQGGGILGGLIGLLTGQESNANPAQKEIPDLMLDTRLADLPVVDNYRWNTMASESPWLAVGWWWLVTALLGWLAWPISFVLFARLRDRGYLLSRAVGWLLSAWILWILVSLGVAQNTVVNSWLAVALLAILSGLAATWQWPNMRAFIKEKWGLLLAGEALFAVAFVGFVLIRMGNPDIWQPWFGGEKFMEFAFLNGILRSPTFPPLDPHFAGGVINYYYFGIYLVAYLIKLTGIYAEIAFNLAIPTLFALTVVNSFAVAYSAIGGGESKAKGKRQIAKGKSRVGAGIGNTEPVFSTPNLPLPQSGGGWEGVVWTGDWGLGIGDLVEDDDLLDIDLTAPEPAAVSNRPETAPVYSTYADLDAPAADPINQSTNQPHPPIPNPQSPIPWTDGFAAALLAPLFVAIIGNLDGLGQILRKLAERGTTDFQSAIPLLETAVRAASGLWRVITTAETLGGYNFWDPSRVLPATINEFPYWSFLFADLHPHMIGIPFTVLFLALALTLIRSYDVDWRKSWPRGLGLLAAFSLVLGTLASVNLWELPTYFGVGV
ncbi:MAG: glycosyltransferase family 39 protein, partial [Caldilineaceae bacterium]|nr:glycosyltransferase family 39 protein [Caldilineaceae bacterium]